MIMIQKYVQNNNNNNQRIYFFLQRKRGRPPKTKSSDGPTPIATYTKHTHINPTAVTLTPAMTNPIMLNEQLMKVKSFEN